MNKLLIGAASVITTLSLAGGVAAAQSGDVSVDLSPGSHVKLDSHNKSNVQVTNKNKLSATNKTTQKANSGKVTVKGNGEGGDATSGDSANTNGTDVSATIDNSGTTLGDASCGCGSGGVGDISVSSSPTAKVTADSHDSTKVTLQNTNDLKVNNTTKQTATTGDVKVTGNGSAGDATSGNASNDNTTTVTFDVTN